MANLLLTDRCVRACPYCFAGERMRSSGSEGMLSWENLIYVADFLWASGDRSISLLGGEPTLHPLFVDFVIYLLERGFRVKVFTSGVMAREALEDARTAFASVPEDLLLFVCNLNSPEQTPASAAETQSVRRFLGTFASRVVPGFNIYRTDFDLEFLFQYISEFGLRKNLRLGIAHPIPGSENPFVPVERLGCVVGHLLSYAPRFERYRIKPGFDCGFPQCLFSDAQLGWLLRHVGPGAKFGCGPAVDIGPDLQVWSCFPLSRYHRKSLFEFDGMREIYKFYGDRLKTIRIEAGGIFEACDDCVRREDGLCAGGCVSHLLSRYKQEAPVRFPEVYA